ncbi:ABC transporter permease [Roseomonas sp. OT10]|uniref:ABC transporter permease n=1 Tax=Roseomonas cutis TaxID=2897332 RepID=UPI001E2E3FA6|nr:ABC transporter permease [Roseomonas sp. OT10]UFN49698.1 ABC transporter permease [Roseomonas sp. OT10]
MSAPAAVLPAAPAGSSAARRPALARWRPALLAVAIPGLVLLFWSVSAWLSPSVLLPAPWEVAQTLVDFVFGGINDDAFSGTFLDHLGASAGRVFGGFAIAALLAVPMGLAIGRLAWVRELLDPPIQMLRPVPVTAWLPLSIMFFGLGAKAALALIALACFFPILLNTVLGVRSVEPRLFEAAAMLGCRGSGLFRQVVLPGALPSIFTGLRLGLGIAWVIIVVGEMTGVPLGLGAVIMEARSVSRTDMILVGMVVMGLAGFLSDRALVAIGRRLLAWSPQHV